VLLILIMRRNLTYVSILDDDGIHCNFGNNKCLLKSNNKIFGLAPMHAKLYLLLLNDSFVMNLRDVTNKQKRSITNETSLKLWHCHLGHISKGGMVHLIREEILHPLDFSDLENCINCIKRKYVKQIKKGAIWSLGQLELIHTDICGTFSVESVDGFSHFITFTDDYSYYGYIFPIRE